MINLKSDKAKLLKIIIISSMLLSSIILFLNFRFVFIPKKTTINPISATIIEGKHHQPISNFFLKDTNNQDFTTKSLRGHWSLLFFGYVDCPSICPATLNIVKQTWQILEQEQGNTPARFIFTSINPTPDSTLKLKTFLNSYNPNFIGLTGNLNNIQLISKQFGIYTQQQSEPNIIDHTSTLLLVDPHAKLRAIFSPPFDPVNLAHDLKLIAQ